MDILPAAEEADEPIQTLQAPAALPRSSKKSILSQASFASSAASFDDPTALPRLSKKSILSRASFASSASVDDPTRNKDDVRRHTSFGNVLKSSLVELATLDGDFNDVWIKEFGELYFNPLPLKRLCYVMCLISAAMLVTDYFDKTAKLGYHERLGIAEHEGEHFWQLMSTIGYATPGATGVISLI